MSDCIKTHPKNGTYLDTYAWVLYVNKDFEEALGIIERAYVNGGNKSAVIVEHYGDILYQNNKKAEAIKKWNEAKAIGKGSPFLDKKISEKKLIEE